ncbi:MAG TPA: hypothetical protein VIF62_33150 [Labilithrix sp.]|jgi:hypothetical protein
MADEEKKPAASALDEPTSQRPSDSKLAAVEDALLAAARAAGDPKATATTLASEHPPAADPETEQVAEKKPPEPVNKVQEWTLAIFMMLAIALFLWMVLRFLRP